jgi:hypothetical protein
MKPGIKSIIQRDPNKNEGENKIQKKNPIN